MEHIGTETVKRVRVAAELEPELIDRIDQERKGRCSRAAIVRMALLDRYQPRQPRRRTKQEVPDASTQVG